MHVRNVLAAGLAIQDMWRVLRSIFKTYYNMLKRTFLYCPSCSKISEVLCRDLQERHSTAKVARSAPRKNLLT